MVNERKSYNAFTGIKGNEYDLSGEIGIGFTSNTQEPFYFDKEDYDLIKNWTWMARHDKRRREEEGYYIEACVGYKENGIRKQIRLHLHHLVLGYDDRILRKSKEKILVDHKNRIKHDCQKDNLQVASLRVNSINKEKQTSNTSGIIGVHFDNRSLNWVARICVKLNKRVVVYSGKDKEKAIIARLVSEYKYYGNNAPQRNLFEEYGITEEFVKNYQQDAFSPKANNSSGISGVTKIKNSETWIAYLNIDKKNRIIYRGKSKEEAIIARLKAEKEFYPENHWQKRWYKEYNIDD